MSSVYYNSISFDIYLSLGGTHLQRSSGGRYNNIKTEISEGRELKMSKFPSSSSEEEKEPGKSEGLVLIIA